MDSMETPKKLGIMAKLRNRKGFSLIEMAIVLVIIGIIIAAIVKGQDLMANARAKQLTSAVSTYRTLAMAFLDRNGRFPGAGPNDLAANVNSGMIVAFTSYSSPTKELQRSMVNRPPQPIVIGSLQFYVFLGHTTGVATTGRNVIAVCKDATCGTAFTADELELIKVVDNSFDGDADAGAGQIRGASTITITGDYVAAATVVNTIATGTVIPWTTAHKAAIWAFDRPF